MKKLFMLLICSALGSSFLFSQFSNKTMDVNGTPRQYRQYLPSGFVPGVETDLPLIIALHGLGDNMTNFSLTGFNYIADTARFIIAFPQGTPNILSQNSWNNGTLYVSSTSDDQTFLSRLIDSMYVNYNIDLSRVYFTGFSMGGIMTYHMLCAMPNRIAAIVSVAGTMADVDVSGCNPGRSVPVMHLHGTNDGTVPYNGSPLPSLSLVPTTINFWVNNNGCSDTTVTPLPDLVPTDSITVDQIEYNTCGEPVELWRENGADHQWLYPPVNDINTADEIWLFFYDKVHPGPSQFGIEDPYGTSDISITYAQHSVHISSLNPIQQIGVYDLSGKALKLVTPNGENEKLIEMVNFPSQPIIVKVFSNGDWSVKKLIHIQ